MADRPFSRPGGENSPRRGTPARTGQCAHLPVWAQKSWGKITSYGGAGYGINPGKGNRNWLFAGWEVQYVISPAITLGGEVYFHSADTQTGNSQTAFNVGGSVNPSEKFHVIFSLGHSLTNDHTFTSYFGLLWTI
jgi:hypothetical protein